MTDIPDDRDPKPCPRCGVVCTYDGWDHVHPNGVGIGSCTPDIPDELVEKGADALWNRSKDGDSFQRQAKVVLEAVLPDYHREVHADYMVREDTIRADERRAVEKAVRAWLPERPATRLSENEFSDRAYNDGVEDGIEWAIKNLRGTP